MSPHLTFTNMQREPGSPAPAAQSRLLRAFLPPHFLPCSGLRKATCRLDHWILPMQRGALRQACLVAKMSSSPVS